MRQLSTRARPRITNRWVVATITAVAIGSAVMWLYGWPHALWPAALYAGVAGTMWFSAAGWIPLAPRGTLDHAWLDGADVLLQRGNRSLRLPLADVASVDYDRYFNLVALVPRVPCLLGDRLRFRTPRRYTRETCTELRARLREVAAARA